MADFFDECSRSFVEASRRFGERFASLEESLACQRPAPDSWSVAECTDHLYHSLLLYERKLEPCLASAPRGPNAIGRGTLTGRLLMWVLDPARKKVRRVRVPKNFEPGARHDIDWSELVAAYPAMCESWIAHIEASRSLPVGRLRLATPMSKWLKVSAAQALEINAAHQGRHLDQAERALRAVQAPRA